MLSLVERYLVITLFMVLGSACSQPVQHDIVYDQNSWKTVIADSCQMFFDGCNNCRRNAGSNIAACTRKACIKYEKPVCLDK